MDGTKAHGVFVVGFAGGAILHGGSTQNYGGFAAGVATWILREIRSGLIE
jgi:hypothetical protein